VVVGREQYIGWQVLSFRRWRLRARWLTRSAGIQDRTGRGNRSAAAAKEVESIVECCELRLRLPQRGGELLKTKTRAWVC
jgi:hypothetical protein